MPFCLVLSNCPVVSFIHMLAGFICTVFRKVPNMQVNRKKPILTDVYYSDIFRLLSTKFKPHSYSKLAAIRTKTLGNPQSIRNENITIA